MTNNHISADREPEKTHIVVFVIQVRFYARFSASGLEEQRRTMCLVVVVCTMDLLRY